MLTLSLDNLAQFFIKRNHARTVVQENNLTVDLCDAIGHHRRTPN